jgi:hypothetical protein
MEEALPPNPSGDLATCFVSFEARALEQEGALLRLLLLIHFPGISSAAPVQLLAAMHYSSRATVVISLLKANEGSKWCHSSEQVGGAEVLVRVSRPRSTRHFPGLFIAPAGYRLSFSQALGASRSLRRLSSFLHAYSTVRVLSPIEKLRA